MLLSPDLPQLSANYLDTNFSAELNILVITLNGHSAWANSSALSSSNINKDNLNPPGGIYVRDKNRDLTGQLLEEPAINELLQHAPLPGVEKFLEAIRVTFKEYARAGLTTTTELHLNSVPECDHACGSLASGNQYLDSVLQGLQDITVPVRLAYYTVVAKEKIEPLMRFNENKWLWHAGVKLFADGSLHCGTAALKRPYLYSDLTEKLCFPPPPNCGTLNWTYDQLLNQVKLYHNAGWQVAIHAQGDRAIDQVLSVYEDLGGRNRRHRIEHMGFATEAQLAKCAHLDVAPSMFVSQLYFYGKSFSEEILGKDCTDNWAPVDFAFKYGCKVSLHQDTPALPGPPQPLASIKMAVTRTHRDYGTTVYGPSHRISVHQAIQAYTTGPAWQLVCENELGRLKVGFRADLVVLSANPYLVDPMKLDDLQSMLWKPTLMAIATTYGCRRYRNIDCY